MADGELLDRLDFALDQLQFYFDDAESHNDQFFSLDELLGQDPQTASHQECRDDNYEYDAPKYFDLSMWHQKIDLFGEEAYYETPADQRINDKWFRQLHLDHEHDELYEPVNLLLLNEGEDGRFRETTLNHDSHMNACAEHALSFMNELDGDHGNKKPVKPIFTHTKRALQSRSAVTSNNHSKSTTMPSPADNLKTAGPLTALTKHLERHMPGAQEHRFLSRNITSRRQKENEVFLRNQDAQPDSRLIRVNPTTCSAPTPRKTETTASLYRRKEANVQKGMASDIKDLIQAQNAASKQYRLAKQAPIPHSTADAAIKADVRKIRRQEESEILSLLKKHNYHAHQQQIQSKKVTKDEDDLLSLLEKHNSSVRRNK